MCGVGKIVGVVDRAKIRQLGGVFICILHSIRSKVDPKALKTLHSEHLESKAAIFNSSLELSLDSIRLRLLFETFSHLESSARTNFLRELSFTKLASMTQSRLRNSFKVLHSLTCDHLATRDHVCQGTFVLYKFFYNKHLQLKNQFFTAGKQLFELEKKSSPPSGRKSLLVKSNSMIAEASQNYMFAMQALQELFARKIESYYK